MKTRFNNFDDDELNVIEEALMKYKLDNIDDFYTKDEIKRMRKFRDKLVTELDRTGRSTATYRFIN